MPEKFRRGILYCCINFVYRKGLDKTGGYQDFRSKVFRLTVPKDYVGESFIVALFSGIEKVWIRRGGVSSLSVENFCLTVPKIYVGESFTNAITSGRENFWIGGGEYQDFPPNIFLSHIAENFRRRNLYCCISFR